MQLDILRISGATKGGMLELSVILRIASVHIINEHYINIQRRPYGIDYLLRICFACK